MAVKLQAIDACLLHMQIANIDAVTVFEVSIVSCEVHLQAQYDALQS